MTTIWAQNNPLLEDLKSLNQHYHDLTTYSMEFEISYFDQSSKLINVQKGHVTHSDDVHFTDLGDQLTLIRGNQFVHVNRSNKVIVYNETVAQKNKDERASQMDIPAMMDSLWKSQKGLSYEYLAAPKGRKKVKIKDPLSPHFEAYTIVIDSKNYQIKEFTYHLKTEDDINSEIGTIKIRYKSETAKPALNEKRLKANYYLKKKSNQWVPTELFAGFRLIDQTKNPFKL